MPLPMAPNWNQFVLHEGPQRGVPYSAEHLHDIRHRTLTLFKTRWLNALLCKSGCSPESKPTHKQTRWTMESRELHCQSNLDHCHGQPDFPPRRTKGNPGSGGNPESLLFSEAKARQSRFFNTKCQVSSGHSHPHSSPEPATDCLEISTFRLKMPRLQSWPSPWTAALEEKQHGLPCPGIDHERFGQGWSSRCRPRPKMPHQACPHRHLGPTELRCSHRSSSPRICSTLHRTHDTACVC